MGEPTLFDAVDAELARLEATPARTIRRNTDPETSHEAARRVEYRTGSQKARILTVYRAAALTGPRPGLTADEVSQILGFNAWRRVSDLLRDGALRDTGQTRKSRYGLAQRVLVVSERGR